MTRSEAFRRAAELVDSHGPAGRSETSGQIWHGRPFGCSWWVGGVLAAGLRVGVVQSQIGAMVVRGDDTLRPATARAVAAIYAAVADLACRIEADLGDGSLEPDP